MKTIKITNQKQWTKFSWKNYLVQQQPNWPNDEYYNQVINEIATYPPLIFAKEAETLKQHLASASDGNNFVIQGGDCAETFADTCREIMPVIDGIPRIFDNFKSLLV